MFDIIRLHGRRLMGDHYVEGKVLLHDRRERSLVLSFARWTVAFNMLALVVPCSLLFEEIIIVLETQQHALHLALLHKIKVWPSSRERNRGSYSCVLGNGG